MILYKQFNFGLASQTFGLVTSSNSLPEGQPHLFIFVSPCYRNLYCLPIFIHSYDDTHTEIFVVITRLYAILSCDVNMFIAVEFPWYCLPTELLTTAFSAGVVLFVAMLRKLNIGWICIPFFYCISSSNRRSLNFRRFAAK